MNKYKVWDLFIYRIVFIGIIMFFIGFLFKNGIVVVSFDGTSVAEADAGSHAARDGAGARRRRAPNGPRGAAPDDADVRAADAQTGGVAHKPTVYRLRGFGRIYG